MRRYAVIKDDRVHRIEEVADDFNIRKIYPADVEIIDVTGTDVQELDSVVRQIGFDRHGVTMTAAQRKIGKENTAKIMESVCEALIAIRDQQSQVSFPEKTLALLSRYEALRDA